MSLQRQRGNAVERRLAAEVGRLKPLAEVGEAVIDALVEMIEDLLGEYSRMASAAVQWAPITESDRAFWRNEVENREAWYRMRLAQLLERGEEEP
ncbi:MAG: hypothetical protein WC554_09795 [Clostridia bacterium]